MDATRGTDVVAENGTSIKINSSNQDAKNTNSHANYINSKYGQYFFAGAFKSVFCGLDVLSYETTRAS